MIVDDLIIKYGVAMSRRYKDKEKLYFLTEIAKDYKSLGYQAKIVLKKGKRRRKAYNLIVGDLAHAKQVIVANYDTPQKDLGNPMLYYPLDGQSSFTASVLPYFMPLILGSAVLLYLFFIWGPKIDFGAHLVRSILIVGSILLTFIIATILTFGYGNRLNVNRNTSGVIVNLLLAEKLKGRKDIAYVLTDNGCTNHLGDDALKERFGFLKINPAVICLDCLGKGKRFGIAYKKTLKSLASKLKAELDDKTYFKEYGEADLKFHAAFRYEKVLTLTYGKLKNQSLVVADTATKKDNDIDPTILKKAVEAVANVLTAAAS